MSKESSPTILKHNNFSYFIIRNDKDKELLKLRCLVQVGPGL